MRLTRSLRILAAGLIATTAFATPSQAQFTIGDPLVARSIYDGYAGFILVVPYSFSPAAYGQAVTSVSIFNGFVGRDFTPLLVANTGPSAWTITGEGTNRVVGASGLQSYAFGLVSGSDLVTAATRVAWRTSSAGGVIPFDFDSDGNLYRYSPNGFGPTTAGSAFPEEGATDRSYAIQFSTSAVTATPEPSTVVLTASGLLAFVGISRRRRSA